MFEGRLEAPFDPLAAVRRLAGQPGLAFLYSGLTAYGLGRFSVLAACPSRRIDLRKQDGDCFAALRAAFPEFASQPRGRLPFNGGCIGYVAYGDGEGSATSDYTARFAYYEGGIVFDHEQGETWLVSQDEQPSEALRQLAARALGEGAGELEGFELLTELQCNFTRAEYLERVRSVRERIRDGDVYQVNLSQRFSGRYAGAGLELFCRLAETSPAPYAAYLNFGDEEIVSSSPERFLLVDEGRATTRPIKGTRPIGANAAETESHVAELEESEKDRSELLMIVDLERNDLGRVCQPGSVAVEGLFGLERYATVIHQTADVSGQLEAGCDAIDCARALFPGGSITGAPKVRAMQLIDELERGERGVYTGAIGYFDVSGRADLSIAIRTLHLANGDLSFQVGGGIVWDSDPESEYEETLLKAKAMIEALKGRIDE